MPTPRPITSRKPLRRLHRPFQVLALATTLSLGATGCGGDLFGGSEAVQSTPDAPGGSVKMNEGTVRSFYARASEAYRTRDAATICAMTQPSYAKAMVEKAVDNGLQISTCEQLWGVLFVADPDGYADRLSDVKVKGKTATFFSGDDPWRVQLIRGEMKIVAPKK
ncbi:MAG: hypothetical protein ACRDO4_01090 [Nocardioides sp.]